MFTQSESYTSVVSPSCRLESQVKFYSRQTALELEKQMKAVDKDDIKWLHTAGQSARDPKLICKDVTFHPNLH